MSKRPSDPSTTAPHLLFKQKQGKSECPGCKQWFVRRYFETHKTKFFCDNEWKCSGQTFTAGHKECNPDVSNTSTQGAHEDEPPIINVVKRQLRRNLDKLDPEKQDSSDESEDEIDEVWNNLTLADIDADFNVGEQSINISNPLFVSPDNTKNSLLRRFKY